jgi:hypothetical protein
LPRYIFCNKNDAKIRIRRENVDKKSRLFAEEGFQEKE